MDDASSLRDHPAVRSHDAGLRVTRASSVLFSCGDDDYRAWEAGYVHRESDPRAGKSRPGSGFGPDVSDRVVWGWVYRLLTLRALFGHSRMLCAVRICGIVCGSRLRLTGVGRVEWAMRFGGQNGQK